MGFIVDLVATLNAKPQLNVRLDVDVGVMCFGSGLHVDFDITVSAHPASMCDWMWFGCKNDIKLDVG